MAKSAVPWWMGDSSRHITEQPEGTIVWAKKRSQWHAAIVASPLNCSTPTPDAPGALKIAPGGPNNAPGALSIAPGALNNAPGALNIAPGAPSNAPDALTTTPGAPLVTPPTTSCISPPSTHPHPLSPSPPPPPHATPPLPPGLSPNVPPPGSVTAAAATPLPPSPEPAAATAPVSAQAHGAAPVSAQAYDTSPVSAQAYDTAPVSAQAYDTAPVYGTRPHLPPSAYVCVFLPRDATFVWCPPDSLLPVWVKPDPLGPSARPVLRELVSICEGTGREQILSLMRRVGLLTVATETLDLSDQVPLEAVALPARSVVFWSRFAERGASAESFEEQGALLSDLCQIILPQLLHPDWLSSRYASWTTECITASSAPAVHARIQCGRKSRGVVRVK
ncbi:hypothetical protein CLOP_g1906 [Closterium sp. NIES-67]|nr:hypothetical protein CLOP_g1906 [Closterium sp. NIES-67]